MKIIRKGLIMASLISILAAFFSGCSSAKSEYIVAEDIKAGDITEFYYTDSATTDPPRFQRYYFHTEDGKYYFTHENRGGTFKETDITLTGTLELSEEEWSEFVEFLSGGSVRNRSEASVTSGSAKALYLYWTGDKGEYQLFEFASSENLTGFEQFCVELKEREMSGH